MIGERLKQYTDAKGINFSKLSKLSGIPQGALSEIRNGKRDPGAETLKKLITNTDISAHWLLTGEGSMIRSIGTIEENDTSLTKLRSVKSDIQALVSDLVDILESDDVVMKTAITENIRAFKISVDRKAKLDSSDAEIDFKTQGSSRESKHLRDKHREGGK
jgi:transcriptional regulator with XRE-family HTH domain